MSKPDLNSLEKTIDKAFDERDAISTETRGEVREAVETSLLLLDSGQVRVAEKQANGAWKTNQWLKKAVLLSFRLNPMGIIEGGPGGAPWWDKVPSKFDGWGATEFAKAGIRTVPGAIVRRSAYIAPAQSSCPLSSISVPMSMKVRWSTHGLALVPALDRQTCPFVGRCRHWRSSGTDAGRPHHH